MFITSEYYSVATSTRYLDDAVVFECIHSCWRVLITCVTQTQLAILACWVLLVSHDTRRKPNDKVPQSIAFHNHTRANPASPAIPRPHNFSMVTSGAGYGGLLMNHTLFYSSFGSLLQRVTWVVEVQNEPLLTGLYMFVLINKTFKTSTSHSSQARRAGFVRAQAAASA